MCDENEANNSTELTSVGYLTQEIGRVLSQWLRRDAFVHKGERKVFEQPTYPIALTFQKRSAFSDGTNLNERAVVGLLSTNDHYSNAGLDSTDTK